jgi:hypothetical protein
MDARRFITTFTSTLTSFLTIPLALTATFTIVAIYSLTNHSAFCVI